MQGLFPAAIRLSPNRVGWHEDAIDEWLKSRPTVQYGSSGKAGADEAV
jgi:predicted DNA-binding transcriptional regulator AlpA